MPRITKLSALKYRGLKLINKEGGEAELDEHAKDRNKGLENHPSVLPPTPPPPRSNPGDLTS